VSRSDLSSVPCGTSDQIRLAGRQFVAVSAGSFAEHVGDVDSLLGGRRSCVLGCLRLAYGEQVLFDLLGLGDKVAVILRYARFAGTGALI
jgi:hypothetical protein